MMICKNKHEIIGKNIGKNKHEITLIYMYKID